MKVAFNGLMEQTATFENGTGVKENAFVKMSDNGTVSICSNGDGFIGAVTAVSGDCSSVQLSGYYKAKYSGSAPAVGYVALASDVTGTAVKTVGTGGRTVLVLDVDTVSGTVGFII